jgi:hypothetical protein
MKAYAIALANRFWGDKAASIAEMQKKVLCSDESYMF